MIGLLYGEKAMTIC